MRRLRAYKLSHAVEEQRRFYQVERSPDEIRRWQLDRFNQEWQRIREDVPYFKQQRCKVPGHFSSWEEFKTTMPVLDRQTIQSQTNNLHSITQKPDLWRTTGGSTSEPIAIGAWKSERSVGKNDLWLARSWFDLAPSSRLFLIWGHSHLLGSGLRGRLNGARRNLTDKLLGYYRFSAYDLSEARLSAATAELLRFRPSYVVGYSSALDRFANHNRKHADEFRQLGLKVAIATAESFPKPDSSRVISEVLGCPVAMEYGSVETGLIAHQTRGGDFRVFWRNYFIEGKESQHLPGAYELLVTSLYARSCPLVRYRVGDLISDDPESKSFLQRFSSVIGRSNDVLEIPGGPTVHSEVFSHAIKDSRSVFNFQVVQSKRGDIVLNYVSSSPLDNTELSAIRDRLNRINPRLGSIAIERVELLEQTIAGKTKRIFRQ